MANTIVDLLYDDLVALISGKEIDLQITNRHMPAKLRIAPELKLSHIESFYRKFRVLQSTIAEDECAHNLSTKVTDSAVPST